MRHSKFNQVLAGLRRMLAGYDKQFALGEALFAEGKIDQAIGLLEALLTSCPHPEGFVRLAQLRHAGFFRKPIAAVSGQWPPVTGNSPYPDNHIPEIQAQNLNAENLKLGILGHGSLLVRGLLQPQQTTLLVNAIDEAFAANDRHAQNGTATEWFSPLQPCRENGETRIARKFIREGGGTLAADSPQALAHLIQVIKSTSAFAAITGYLTETPALSAKKTTLRRVSPDSNSGWHQDGAFLGENIRTVNLWIALSDCGADAPSMDMIPRRLDSIIATGGGAASFSWSLDNATVAEATGNLAPVRLQFKAGDAILFDELNLHRTAADKSMTNSRYAIEAWFFAPSTYPLGQIPVLC